MKKSPGRPKKERYITEDFFTKKLTETIQDLKGFMLETFSTKVQLAQGINGLRDEMNVRFEQVDGRFDKIDEKLEEIDQNLIVHTTELEKHDKRMTVLEHKN